MDCFDGHKPPILAATLLQTVVRMILPCYKFVKDRRLECLKQFFKFLLPLCNECRNPPGRGAGGGVTVLACSGGMLYGGFLKNYPRKTSPRNCMTLK